MISEAKADSFENSLLEDKSFDDNNNYSNLNTTHNNQIKNLNNTRLDSLKESIASKVRTLKKNREAEKNKDCNNNTINDSEIINENNFSKISSATYRKSEKQKIEEYFKSNFYNNIIAN